MFTLHNGDCLQVLPSIPSGSIDAIITDLPYGTTACEWDSIIPLAPMWEQVKRVLKPTGTFITTSSQPFTSFLISSNLEMFKYEIVWKKTKSFGVFHAKNMPLKKHENIVVFSRGVINHEHLTDNRMTYNPQMEKGRKHNITWKLHKQNDHRTDRPSNINKSVGGVDEYYPCTVIEFAKDGDIHPTQKPVALYRYLIRTYTNPGEIVLDITMGSGTTGVACVQEGRDFIGIEKELSYFSIAESRLKEAVLQPNFFTPSNNRLHLTGGGLPATQSSFTAEVIPPAKLPAKSPRR